MNAELPMEVWEADPEGEPVSTPNAAPDDEDGPEGEVEDVADGD